LTGHIQLTVPYKTYKSGSSKSFLSALLQGNKTAVTRKIKHLFDWSQSADGSLQMWQLKKFLVRPVARQQDSGDEKD
jgi:hypothetical protein